MTEKSMNVLPPEFSDLEAFVAGWGNASTNVRHHTRQTSSMEAIKAFYEAMQSRIEAIFDYLDDYNVWTLSPPAQNLLYLTFGYIEASLAVEVFKMPGVPGVVYPNGFFEISRELR